MTIQHPGPHQTSLRTGRPEIRKPRLLQHLLRTFRIFVTHLLSFFHAACGQRSSLVTAGFHHHSQMLSNIRGFIIEERRSKITLCLIKLPFAI